MPKSDVEEKLWGFLAAYFHQDITSEEAALDEFIADAGVQGIREMIDVIHRYLLSAVPEDEKNRWIEDSTMLYFPALGLTPVQWLWSVLERLRQAIGE